jgi:hypothetical protein
MLWPLLTLQSESVILWKNGGVSDPIIQVVYNLFLCQILGLKITLFDILDEGIGLLVFGYLVFTFLIALITSDGLRSFLEIMNLFELKLTNELLSHCLLIVV